MADDRGTRGSVFSAGQRGRVPQKTDRSTLGQTERYQNQKPVESVTTPRVEVTSEFSAIIEASIELAEDASNLLKSYMNKSQLEDVQKHTILDIIRFFDGARAASLKGREVEENELA